MKGIAMFARVSVVVLFVCFVMFQTLPNAQAQVEGLRTNKGVGESADYHKLTPGYHYDPWTKANQRNRTYFYVSEVKLCWYPGEYPDSDWHPERYPRYPDSKRSVSVPCYNNGTPMRFCILPKGATLADVEDPSALPFREPASTKTKVMRQYVKHYVNGKPVYSKPFELKDGRIPAKSRGNIDTKTIIGTPYAKLSAGQCVVFKVNDNKYIGLSPVKIDVAMRHQAEIGETGLGGTMQYEWRSWTMSVWSDQVLQQYRQARN